jgi:hypothetical protein
MGDPFDVDEGQLGEARRALTSGPQQSFADWPPLDLPIGPPGVYAIWRDDALLYIGMSWRDSAVTKGASGVHGRLKSHASGRRSGDQFNIYICDRFVVPELTSDQLNQLSAGERLLDKLTRQFIAEHLGYQVWVAPSGPAARRVELALRKQGLPGHGVPQLNPGTRGSTPPRA